MFTLIRRNLSEFVCGPVTYRLRAFLQICSADLKLFRPHLIKSVFKLQSMLHVDSHVAFPMHCNSFQISVFMKTHCVYT